MADYAKMTVPLLREQLAARGLDTGGLKAALVARLVAAAEVGAPAAEPAAQVAALPPAAEAAPAAPPPAPPVAAEPAPPPARVEAKRKEPEPSVAPASASVPPASAEEAPARKRSRWDSADAAAPAAPAAHAPPALPTAGETAAAAAPDAATKAREMLQKKNELAEKLAKLRQLKGAAGAGAAPAAPPASGALFFSRLAPRAPNLEFGKRRFLTPFCPLFDAALPSSLAGVLAPDAVARVQAIASRLAAGGPTQAGLLRAPGTTGFSAAPALAPPAPRSRPVALRLDAQGREVDEAGNVIVREVKATATLRVNARAQKAEELRALMDEARREVAAETAAGGVDEAAKRRARESRSLQFLDPGLVTQRAEASRMQAALRAQFGDAADAEARKLAARAKRREDEAARIAGYEAAGAAEAAAGHAGADVAEADVPDTEWWDAPLLGGASYDGVLSGTAAMAVDKISVYVEHPVPLMPPGEAPPPPPQPLKLTAKEQKKLRTQRRVAREKERQEMLRQGLLEPPKPKVRIANLMRVLGEQATADPTAIEKEVRAQMAERAAAHEDRNAARALTPAERREKQARKLFEETNGGTSWLGFVLKS
jgi:U4/U6 small nuclear ribonucleoprotein PRP3